MCTGLWVKRSGSPVESMCYDFGLNSLFSQCLSTARSINGHWWIVKEACWNARCNVTKDWHAKKTEISSHWMGYLAWAQTFHLKCCEKNLSFSSFTEKKKMHEYSVSLLGQNGWSDQKLDLSIVRKFPSLLVVI